MHQRRAVEWYQTLVLESSEVDFSDFKKKLGELAAMERRRGGGTDDDSEVPGVVMLGVTMPEVVVAGEGSTGCIDENEPEPVRALQARMRLLHHPKSTEEAYCGWLHRFIRHLDDERVQDW